MVTNSLLATIPVLQFYCLLSSEWVTLGYLPRGVLPLSSFDKNAWLAFVCQFLRLMAA